MLEAVLISCGRDRECGVARTWTDGVPKLLHAARVEAPSGWAHPVRFEPVELVALEGRHPVCAYFEREMQI